MRSQQAASGGVSYWIKTIARKPVRAAWPTSGEAVPNAKLRDLFLWVCEWSAERRIFSLELCLDVVVEARCSLGSANEKKEE